ncbi:hypothetical protein TIFTF001_008421 [Ficus carica]|uniref:Uncharacterized protein n=1 Tax=Ficus carica TaxID=3494 RepID=A0AA87ZN05_FICCA|nr:hypothetical protein TIFTF001_008421 [Ficus carica]
MPGECRLDVNEEIPQEKKSASRASASHEDRTKVFTKDDEKLLKELKGSIENGKSDGQEDEDEFCRPKMKKVLNIMLKNENIKKYFTAREFPVGPLQSPDFKLNRELKVELARKFIKNSGKTEDSLLKEIKNNISSLKDCFGKGVKFEHYNSDDKLARLFFLDGCAVLQFIHSYVSGKLKEFKINNIQKAWIQQDLFLFGNQLPFAVLELLIDLVGDKEKEALFPKSSDLPFSFAIVKFVHGSNICAPTVESERAFDYSGLENTFETLKPVHLLDLLRTVSIFGSVNNVEAEDDALNSDDQRNNCLSSCFGFRKPRPPNALQHPQSTLQTIRRIDERSFRNVQELKSSGIKIKPSNSRSLKSVSFSTHCFGVRGHLKLPTLTVNTSTVYKLLNLVAHEMWLDDAKKCRVTSYLDFMDMLIDSEQDAKDLRAAYILRNSLSSDAAVAELFNTIGGSIYFSKNQDDYDYIKNKIEEHYKNNYAIWMAQVLNDHFSNPWTVVALFAAAVALILTLVQTWYAVNPKQ